MLYITLLAIVSVMSIFVADRNYTILTKSKDNMPTAVMCGVGTFLFGICASLTMDALTGQVTSGDHVAIILFITAAMPVSIVYSLLKAK